MYKLNTSFNSHQQVSESLQFEKYYFGDTLGFVFFPGSQRLKENKSLTGRRKKRQQFFSPHNPEYKVSFPHPTHTASREDFMTALLPHLQTPSCIRISGVTSTLSITHYAIYGSDFDLFQ